MATVRITKRIKSDILAQAAQVANSQRTNLPEAEPKLGKDIITFLIDKYKIPTKGHKDILNEINQIHFTNLVYLSEDNQDADDYPLDIIINPPIKLIVPWLIATATNIIWLNNDDINFEFSTSILNDLQILVRKRISIESQCDVFMRTIKDLIKRCTTLKQFIEAWPQGEQFISQTALRLHYEQEKKQRKRGIYLDNDTLADLNSILLTSKIV